MTGRKKIFSMLVAKHMIHPTGMPAACCFNHQPVVSMFGSSFEFFMNQPQFPSGLSGNRTVFDGPAH